MGGEGGVKKVKFVPANDEKVAELKALLKGIDPNFKSKELTQKALKTLAGYGIEEILEKYPSQELKRKIVGKLIDEINRGDRTWSPKRTRNMIAALELESVQRALNRYSVMDAQALAQSFMEKANSFGIGAASPYGSHFNTIKRGALEKVAQIMAQDEIFECFNAYNKELSWIMLMQFANQIIQLREEERLEKAMGFAKALMLPHVVGAINRLAGLEDDSGGRAAQTTVSNLLLGIGRSMETGLFVEVIEVLSLCNAYLASSVTFEFAQLLEVKKKDRARLSQVATILKDKEVMEKLNSTVLLDMHYSTSFAARVAMKTQDKQMVLKVLDFYIANDKILKQIEGINAQAVFTVVKLGLEEVCTNKHKMAWVTAYATSGGAYLRPTSENLKVYENELLTHLKNKYGLEKDLNMDEMLMLSHLGRGRIRKAIEIINRSKDESVKKYSLTNRQQLKFDYTSEQLLEHAAVGLLGSRDKEREARAISVLSEIVGIETLNKARNELSTKYRELKNGIFSMIKQDPKDKSLYNKIYVMLSSAQSELVMDVLEAAKYNEMNIKAARFVRAAESKNILDYDSRNQIACVFLPRGSDIYNYSTNKDIVLVKYDLGKKSLGSAICYLKEGNLIVDSVEGHRIFRKDAIFEIVYNDLVERAREKGLERIIFGTNGANKTAKGFVKYIADKGLKDMTVEFNIKTNGYLETEKGSVALVRELRA